MKKITIMRGIPGSGKSTYANQLGGKVVSADNFFMVGDEYKFDPTKLKDAHRDCMQRFLNLVNIGFAHIVVDNTNINLEDLTPYVAVGEAMGYEVEIVELTTRPDVAGPRNIHGVPLNRVIDMGARMKPLPQRFKVTYV